MSRCGEEASGRLYGGSVLALSVAAVNVMIGFGLFMPFLPYYATLLGATLGIQVGAIASGFMLTRGLAVTPFGRLSDKIGRRPIIALGLLIYAGSTLPFPFATDWTHLLIFRAMQGVGAGMFWPAATALIADSVLPGQRGRALGFFNTWVMVGIVLGPALGGAIQFYGFEVLGLSEIDSYRIPFYFGGIFSAVSSVIAFIFIKEGSRRVASHSSTRGLGIAKPFKKTFRTLLAVRFANGFALIFIQPVLAFYFRDVLGLERTDAVLWLAASFFVSGLAGAAVQLPAGNLADRGGRKKLMLIGVLAASVATILIPLAGGVLIIVALMGLRAAFMGLYQPSSLSIQEDIMPRNIRGKLTGVTEAFWNMGAISGPLFGFFLYDYFDKAFPFYASAMIFAASIIAFTVWGKDPKVEESEL